MDLLKGVVGRMIFQGSKERSVPVGYPGWQLGRGRGPECPRPGGRSGQASSGAIVNCRFSGGSIGNSFSADVGRAWFAAEWAGTSLRHSQLARAPCSFQYTTEFHN